ncbi:PulJ/GspJ family protein [Bordetella sp. 2513F-2]
MTRRIAGLRAQRGFTLIEVLVAVALMALVSLMAWRGLAQVATTREAIGRNAEDNDMVIRTLGQMDRDLAETYLGSGTSVRTMLPAGVTVPPGSGAPQLRIVRAAPGLPGWWQQVVWQLRPDGLWRYAGAPGDRYPLPEPQSGALVLPDVTAMQVRAWVPGRGWAALPAALPAPATGLDVSLQRRVGSVTRPYNRIVVLP